MSSQVAYVRPKRGRCSQFLPRTPWSIIIPFHVFSSIRMCLNRRGYLPCWLFWCTIVYSTIWPNYFGYKLVLKSELDQTILHYNISKKKVEQGSNSYYLLTLNVPTTKNCLSFCDDVQAPLECEDTIPRICYCQQIFGNIVIINVRPVPEAWKHN